MTVVKHMLAAVVGLGVLSACMEDPPSLVPDNAMLAVEGNQKLSYRAPSSGLVYIIDVPAERRVYSGKVDKGQLITVDVAEDRVLIDDRPVLEKGLNRGATHKVYFVREGTKIVEETTVTHEQNITTD